MRRMARFNIPVARVLVISIETEMNFVPTKNALITCNRRSCQIPQQKLWFFVTGIFVGTIQSEIPTPRELAGPRNTDAEAHKHQLVLIYLSGPPPI
jgi:hypothetical protein